MKIQEIGHASAANIFILAHGVTDPERQFGIRLTFEGFAECMGYNRAEGPKKLDMETLMYAHVFAHWHNDFQL